MTVRTPRGHRFAAWTAAAALALAGCSSASTAAGGSGTTRPTLTMAVTFLPSAVDPAQGIDAVFSFAETLTTVNDQGQAASFLLAKAPAEISPSHWTLDLRPHVTFQDGHAMTASVVAAGMNREVKVSADVQSILPGAKFTATGPLTVSVVTMRPTPLLPYLLADRALSVYDEPVAAAAGNAPDALVGKGVFTAPYAITAFSSTQMVLAPYDHYWQGRPVLGGVKVLYVADPLSRAAAVESGQAQIADGENSPQVRQAISGKGGVALRLSDEPQGAYQLWFNTASAPLSDVSVRRAIALAISYQSLATKFTAGVDTPGTSILPPAYPLTVPTQQTNVAEAKQLLAADGWKAGPGGVRTKNGKTLSVTLLIYNERPLLQPLSIGLQSMLSQIGVSVKISSQPFSYQMYASKTSWNLALYHNYAISPTGVPDPYLAGLYGTNGTSNYWHLSDPKLDHMLTALASVTSQAERKTELAAIQQYVWNQAYQVTVAYERDGSLVSSSYPGYTPDNGYQQAEWTWQTAPGK